MASRKRTSKKRKRSSLSPQPRRDNPKSTAGATLQQSEAAFGDLFLPVKSSLMALQETPSQISDGGVSELVKLGKHVARLASEPGMNENDRNLLWMFVCSHWPHRDPNATDLRNMHVCIILYLEVEAENISANFKLKPFLETNLGRLAPEIRGIIFTNLLAFPPSYGGRDFRVRSAPMAGRSPVSLITFVDLKASCLATLQTCRQMYLEAFPKFYANKSYYLANSQDLARFLKNGRVLHRRPRLLRFDAITSLCLKDLTTTRPMWTPRQVDDLISHVPDIDRATLEAERTNELDANLFFANLAEMKNLRKICLCMRVGQEWQYLRFLFGIRGLKRGVIEFVDNFHWTIRSQSVSEGNWSLQYTPFPAGSYRRGKEFEILDYEDVKIQGEILNIDSRASDLVEGDERWVEVEIGSRNYEEGLPQQQHVSVIVPAPVLENQQGIADGEGDGFPSDDGSDHETEHQQGHRNRDLEGRQTDNESDHESDEPQEQNDGQGDNAQIDSEQKYEFGDLYYQLDEDESGSRNENDLDLSSDPQGLADSRDDGTQAESNTNEVLGTPQRTANEDSASISNGTETGNLGAPLHNIDDTTPTAIESDQGLEDSMGLPEGKATDDQEETDHPLIPEKTSEMGNKHVLEHQPTETMQATTELIIGFPSSEYCDARTQTEQREPVKEVHKRTQIAARPTLKVPRPDQGAVEQSMLKYSGVMMCVEWIDSLEAPLERTHNMWLAGQQP